MKFWLPSLLLLLLSIALSFLMPFNLAFLTRILIMVVLVLSLDLVLGYAGIATLGQPAHSSAGAYAAGLFAVHVWADPFAGLLDQFALGPLADRKVGDLAYGQQRLVELALTLALKPRVLILDEPAAGVPSSETHLIVEAIERLPGDLAVLIIEHDMDLVFRVARRIVVLVQGRILTEGSPEEIVADTRVRTLYLGGSHD